MGCIGGPGLLGVAVILVGTAVTALLQLFQGLATRWVVVPHAAIVAVAVAIVVRSCFRLVKMFSSDTVLGQSAVLVAVVNSEQGKMVDVAVAVAVAGNTEVEVGALEVVAAGIGCYSL